ncbi:D-alanyl-D-alanine carboxypeptidase [Fulvivirga imtechensis AK7]|uniref:D-alanyl-D-alanine carboxypeptidase n=1 Tax=Fulvivirga imtechensis AK7 TaxID=1237149 RepID=L8K0H6_9BACT|nr:serine hydrolase [Fulvivirga imtechensis]ELR72982.1 D-alanyl-D-alanine carboxypeptidase [Fulvivirga imtechensis AK7]
MKRLNLTLPLVFFVLLSYGQSPSDKTDSLLQQALPEKEHAVAVLVAKGNDIIYQKALGYADREAKLEANLKTTFRIGSVTKQFTAVAILKLVEMGKMKLDDPLSKYILDFPRGEEVTIHHLLTHVSGIRSYTDQPEFLHRVTVPVDQGVLIEEIKSLGYEFSPGEQWKYNNSAYYILGYLVEKVSGMSYEKFLTRHFFQPAGMTNTGVYHNDKKPKNEAKGYSLDSADLELALDWDMTWAGGAGNMYSTVSDLHRWNQKLFAGALIQKDLLEKAHTKVKLNDGSEYPYGYGWGVGEYKGLRRIAHGGGLHGFLSSLIYYPELDATIVVLSNASPPGNIVPTSFAENLTKIYFEEHLEKDEEVEVDYALYDKYTGKYEYPGGVIMTVSRDGAHLYGQLTGQARYEIFPKGDHRFFWKVVDAQVTFHLNEQGEVDYAAHSQGGFEAKAPRIADQQEVALEEGAFERYSGEYNMNGTNVKIWEEENRYYIQLEGQPRFEIFPKSDNRFFLKDLVAEIEFGSEEPKATSFTLYQGGREIKARRQ